MMYRFGPLLIIAFILIGGYSYYSIIENKFATEGIIINAEIIDCLDMQYDSLVYSYWVDSVRYENSDRISKCSRYEHKQSVEIYYLSNNPNKAMMVGYNPSQGFKLFSKVYLFFIVPVIFLDLIIKSVKYVLKFLFKND